MSLIDLRSDTLTMPDAPMREIMARAKVGDDVYGEDPTIQALEERAASLLGKQSGLFFPSGTQSNLCAMLTHCQRGDEYIAGESYHVYRYEAGGASAIGAIVACPLPVGEDGCLCPHQIRAVIKEDDPHYPISRLLCLENTVNGLAVLLPALAAASEVARAHGLAVHLDGARLLNAVCALQIPAHVFARLADSVSLCISKGLGAPIGTVLCGETKFIAAARRYRKMLGGGMRQAGIVAAAGLYALEHNINRLAEDHLRAKKLADGLSRLAGLQAAYGKHHTNMVYIQPDHDAPDHDAPDHDAPDHDAHEALYQYFLAHQIKIGKQKPAMRAVIHKDIDDAAIDRVLACAASYCQQINPKLIPN